MASKFYPRIYLSPHLDDVALSCGGRIYQECQAGVPVLVVTLMTGDAPPEALEAPFVIEIHTRWELAETPNPVAARRAEDREAMSVLGAEPLHWGWPDCIYRRDPESGEFLYHSESALFGPPHPPEERLIPRLARRLANLPLAPGGRAYAPLTVGGHVDHRLTRQAAEAWGPPDGELVYYEDYPYAEQADALTAVLGGRRGWQAEHVSLDEEALVAKTAAITQYRSQISTFFDEVGEIGLRLRAYAVAAGEGRGHAERYWRRE